MAKYDAAGDKVRNSPPAALWIMLAGVVIAVIGFIWCMNTDLTKYAKTENLYTDQNTSEVKNLDFEFDNADTQIVKSSDNQIQFSHTDRKTTHSTFTARAHGAFSSGRVQRYRSSRTSTLPQR